jgi:hypothetical protein
VKRPIYVFLLSANQNLKVGGLCRLNSADSTKRLRQCQNKGGSTQKSLSTMTEPAHKGAGTDEATGLMRGSLARWTPVGRDSSCTCFSNAELLEFNPRRAPAAASLQSEGDLAVRERRRTRRERRPSGRSDREGARTTGGAGRGGCGAVLDPRRITVRRQPNGRVRLSTDVIRGVRCGAVRGWLL